MARAGYDWKWMQAGEWLDLVLVLVLEMNGKPEDEDENDDEDEPRFFCSKLSQFQSHPHARALSICHRFLAERD